MLDTLWFATGGGKTETYTSVHSNSGLLRQAAGKEPRNHFMGTIPLEDAVSSANPAICGMSSLQPS